MPPDDPTPLGDAMTHRFPDQRIPKTSPEVPTPEPAPPTNNPDPQPGDGKPKAPPADDEPGRRVVPVELPGREHAPERAADGASKEK